MKLQSLYKGMSAWNDLKQDFEFVRRTEEDLAMALRELVIVIGIIGWFARTAKTKRLNKSLWGLIGGLSSYGPAVFVAGFIYPGSLMEKRFIFPLAEQAQRPDPVENVQSFIAVYRVTQGLNLQIER